MEVVYLIGNGFDLSIGLDTAPKAFIESYLEKNNSDSGRKEHVTALVKDMQEQGIETWADFEMESGEYSKRFAEDVGDDAFAYAEACSDLFKHLHEKLSAQNNRVDKAFVEQNSMECIRSLTDFREESEADEQKMIDKLRMAHANEHWIYELLAFNYTDVLDKFVSYVLSEHGEGLAPVVSGTGQKHLIKQVIHVHQSLENPIICGVDDADQIAYEPFRLERAVVETLVKQESQRYLRRDDDTRGFALIDQAKIICVYGMSLGLSDRRWWKAVANHLQQDSEALLVLMSYGLCEETPHTAFAKWKLLEKERNRFFAAAEIENQEQKDVLSKRIIVIPSTAILTIANKLEE